MHRSPLTKIKIAIENSCKKKSDQRTIFVFGTRLSAIRHSVLKTRAPSLFLLYRSGHFPRPSPFLSIRPKIGDRRSISLTPLELPSSSIDPSHTPPSSTHVLSYDLARPVPRGPLPRSNDRRPIDRSLPSPRRTVLERLWGPCLPLGQLFHPHPSQVAPPSARTVRGYLERMHRVRA